MNYTPLHEYTLFGAAGPTELVDNSYVPLPVMPKSPNGRTAKTIWKERRRRANLPHSMQKRLRLAGA